MFISSDFNTTSFNWWMETAAKGGQAKPEQGNATSFNWWFFTSINCSMFLGVFFLSPKF